MESNLKRPKSHETRRNFSPERKTKRKRSPDGNERFAENKRSRREEIISNESSKRRYSGKEKKDQESRGKRRHYRSSFHDRGTINKHSSSSNSHLMKEDSEFDKSRNPRENKGDSRRLTNGSDKQNRGENIKSYETHNGSKTQRGGLSKDHSPRQRSQSHRKSPESRNSRGKEDVQKQINKMLSFERHHTKYIERSTSGEVTSVHWCPRFISPEIKGHARGGKALLHHRCRTCKKLCFHLLGTPGKIRLCLACSNYKKKYIPDWYYHKGCRDCR